MWKRLVVVSGEDCYGIITSKIVKLKELDEKENLPGMAPNLNYVDRAVKLLCIAYKNRDACYSACNFMVKEYPFDTEKIDDLDEELLEDLKKTQESIPDWIFEDSLFDEIEENYQFKLF